MIDVDVFNQYMEQTLGFDSMFSMSFDSLIDIDNRTNKLDCIFNFTSANTITCTNNTQLIRVPAEACACVHVYYDKSLVTSIDVSSLPRNLVYTSSKNKQVANIINSHWNNPILLLVNTFLLTHHQMDMLDQIFIWLTQNKEKNLMILIPSQ